jgi:hypothetical protein
MLILNGGCVVVMVVVVVVVGLPNWFTDYVTFLHEPKQLFGPRDPITDVMNNLENLKYQDFRKATCYTICRNWEHQSAVITLAVN